MELIWHYTSCVHFENIIKDMFLKVSETEKLFGIKPAIWFSKNPKWEPTASKMLSNGNWMTMEEQFEEIGMIRFGIEFSEQLTSWYKYRHSSKIDTKLYKDMEKLGIEKGGNPKDWYCSFKNIPSELWITAEQFDGENWINIMSES